MNCYKHLAQTILFAKWSWCERDLVTKPH